MIVLAVANAIVALSWTDRSMSERALNLTKTADLTGQIRLAARFVAAPLARLGWSLLSIGFFASLWELAWAFGWANPHLLPPPHIFLGDILGQDIRRVRDDDPVRRSVHGVDEIIAFSIGPPKSVDTLRTAMAMGADRSIFVETKEGEEVEPLAVGKVIRELVKREGINLVVCGKQSIDDDAGQTGQIVAGLMGWGAATQASRVTFGEKGVEVEKEVDGGTGMLKLLS